MRAYRTRVSSEPPATGQAGARGGVAAIGFACNPVAVTIEVRAITWLTSTDGGGTGSSGRVEVAVINVASLGMGLCGDHTRASGDDEYSEGK